MNSPHLGYILLISHLISCILVGAIFRNWKKSSQGVFYNIRDISKNQDNNVLSDLGEILSNSIKNSIRTIVNIGGFVVIFSVLISILNSSGFFNLTGVIFEKINISGDLRKFYSFWNNRAYKWSKIDEFITN